jgi:hypothetical protein
LSCQLNELLQRGLEQGSEGSSQEMVQHWDTTLERQRLSPPSPVGSLVSMYSCIASSPSAQLPGKFKVHQMMVPKQNSETAAKPPVMVGVLHCAGWRLVNGQVESVDKAENSFQLLLSALDHPCAVPHLCA